MALWWSVWTYATTKPDSFSILSFSMRARMFPTAASFGMYRGTKRNPTAQERPREASSAEY